MFIACATAIIPLVGNAAEHGAAVMTAAKDKMDLSFTAFEVTAVALSTMVVTVIALDG